MTTTNSLKIKLAQQYPVGSPLVGTIFLCIGIATNDASGQFATPMHKFLCAFAPNFDVNVSTSWLFYQFLGR